MKKYTFNKKSISLKILIPTLITIIILSIVLAMRSYNTQKKNLISNGISYSSLFSKTTLNTIDPIYFERVRSNNDINSDAYNAIYSSLKNVKTVKNIDKIYTLYYKDNQLYYGVLIDNKKDTKQIIGRPYNIKKNSKLMYKTLINCKTYSSQEIFYDNNNIPHILSIAPLYNEKGSLLGGVGCEYNASSIIKTLNKTTISLVLFTVIAVIICTLLIVILIHKIISNITIINHKMITLVNNEGDLTQKLSIKSGDEIEKIADNTNKFIASIHRMMLNIFDNTKNLEKSTSISYNIMEQTYGEVSKTNSTLLDINKSMTDAVNYSNNITVSSNKIIKTVDNLTKLINNGSDNSIIINNLAKDSNKKHTQNYEEATKKANELSIQLNKKLEQSKEISKIANLASTIIEITEQTNLLALNASIESARSGEHGKGFSIVAEEIGKLASNTESSAIQIQKVSNNIINSVEDLTTSAHTMLDYLENVLFKGYKELVDYSNLYNNDSHELSNIFKQFSDYTESLTNNIKDIQNSITLVINNINSNALNIDALTNLSTTLTEKNKQLFLQIDEIKDVYNKLNFEVNKFKV